MKRVEESITYGVICKVCMLLTPLVTATLCPNLGQILFINKDIFLKSGVVNEIKATYRAYANHYHFTSYRSKGWKLKQC
jgi:hypothetical protein